MGRPRRSGRPRGRPREDKYLAKGWIVYYEGEESVFFTHALNASTARWKIVQAHKRRKGFTRARAHVCRELHDKVITVELLESMGYVLKPEQKSRAYWQNTPICKCDFCLEHFNARFQEEKTD